jgi:hypothetical protein
MDYKTQYRSIEKSSSLMTSLLPKEEEDPYFGFMDSPTSIKKTDFDTYIVQDGDEKTISSFALNRKIDFHEFMALNNLDVMDELYTGQKLILPKTHSE